MRDGLSNDVARTLFVYVCFVVCLLVWLVVFVGFFFNYAAMTVIYTRSLRGVLPLSVLVGCVGWLLAVLAVLVGCRGKVCLLAALSFGGLCLLLGMICCVGCVG